MLSLASPVGSPPKTILQAFSAMETSACCWCPRNLVYPITDSKFRPEWSCLKLTADFIPSWIRLHFRNGRKGSPFELAIKRSSGCRLEVASCIHAYQDRSCTRQLFWTGPPQVYSPSYLEMRVYCYLYIWISNALFNWLTESRRCLPFPPFEFYTIFILPTLPTSLIEVGWPQNGGFFIIHLNYAAEVKLKRLSRH